MKKSSIITLIIIIVCFAITASPFFCSYLVGADSEKKPEEYEVMRLVEGSELGENLFDVNKVAKTGNVTTVTDVDRTGAQSSILKLYTEKDGSSYIYKTFNGAEMGTYILSGWSKSENVIRDESTEYFSYALVAMVYYIDGTTKEFSTLFSYGTHDWEYREISFTAFKPVSAITVYAFLRNPASGTAFFDDISFVCADNNSGFATFDDLPVETKQTALGQGTRKTLKTNDGLEMGLGYSQITSLTIDGKSIMSDAFSGFLARDIAAEEKKGVYSFKPDASSTPENFSGKTENLGLGISANYAAKDDHIEISGVVTDTTKNDDGRAVQLSFALPVSASGWKYGTSVITQDDISCGKTSDVYKELGSGNLSVVDWDSEASTYFPTTAVYNEELGIAIATAMDFPCYWELEYNGSTNSYVITYQLGITEEAPDAARFKFVIYKLDAPEWGFRSSMKKYGTIFKDYYTSNEEEHGLWLAWADVSNVLDVDDFGFKFKEVSGTTRTSGFFEQQHGIKGFYYIEPGDWWISNLQTTTPDGIWAKINELASQELGDTTDDKNKAKYQAVATYFCQVKDINGNIAFNPVNNSWCPNGSQVHINANPALPSEWNFYNLYLNQERMDMLFDPIKANGVVFDGIYLDELSGWWLGNANFNKEHYQYTTVPLTYSPYYKKAMLRRASTTWEFVKQLSTELRSMGKSIFANKCPDKHAFYVPLIDAMGTEQTAHSGSVYTPQSIRQLSTWRTLTYTKPFSILFNNDYNIIDHDLMEKYFARCLPYAIFPSPCNNYADGSFYWRGQDKFYERDRDIFQKYIPTIKACSEAGWEPVTYAYSDDSNLIIERYGDNDAEGIYFVIYNDSSEERKVSVKFDLSKFELADSCTCVETLFGETVTLENGVYNATLLGDQSVCIRIQDPNKVVADDEEDEDNSSGGTVGEGSSGSGNTNINTNTNTNTNINTNTNVNMNNNSGNYIGQSIGATNKITEITQGADVLKIINHHLTKQLEEFKNKETYQWTIALIVVDALLLVVGTLLFILYRKKHKMRTFPMPANEPEVNNTP